jgi:UTP-glucose-1-phosphate uridylyltransferase
MKPTLLILAAGMGSRYGGLKQIDPVGPNGETIMEYSIYDAIRAGFGKVVFVIRESFADEFKARFAGKLDGKIQVEYVCQELDKLPDGFVLPEDRVKPWGTGHAILMARDVIHEPFAAINADDFYGAGAYQVLADFFKESSSENEYSMVGYRLDRTLSDFGTVSRGVSVADHQDNLTRITEVTKIGRDANGVFCIDENEERQPLTGHEIVSMNFWGFKPSLFQHLESLFVEFLKDNLNQPKSEFYIPSVVFSLIQSGTVTTKVLKADSPWFGVTYQEDRPFVISQVRSLTDRGIYPEKLW